MFRSRDPELDLDLPVAAALSRTVYDGNPYLPSLSGDELAHLEGDGRCVPSWGLRWLHIVRKRLGAACNG